MSQQFGRAGVTDAFADIGYSAIPGQRAGEQHWRMVLTGFAQATNCDRDRFGQTHVDPRPRLQGATTLLGPWTGIAVTGAPGRLSLPAFEHTYLWRVNKVADSWGRGAPGAPRRIDWQVGLAEQTQPAHER